MRPFQNEWLTNITYTRLRPVVDTGKANPSKESREEAVWDENNLLTVSGGKMTTFRIMARDALKAAHRHLAHIHFQGETLVLQPIPPENEALLANSSLSAALFASTSSSDLEPVPARPYLGAELRLAARAESVLHLDDSFCAVYDSACLLRTGAATCFRVSVPSFSLNLAGMTHIGMKKSDHIRKSGKRLIGWGSRNAGLDPGFLTRIGMGV